MRRRTWMVLSGCVPVLGFLACQGYDFVFQPQSDRQGTHLRFTVQQPSKADILFVVDNSGSMLDKQAALAASINHLLESLAPQDTSYRIGIVSTDGHGFTTDCDGNPNPPDPFNTVSPDPSMGAKGNCGSPNVVLRRPHDGTMGRLIAAYDPNAFSLAAFPSLVDNPNAQAVLARLLPTGDRAGPPGNADPVGNTNNVGARWIIDREAIRQEACANAACGCALCQKGNACFDDCADPVAQALVQAYFRANIAGLGNGGFAWEEGLKNALWAVGIDPEDPNDASALNPTYNTTAVGHPNSYTYLDDNGTLQVGSWVRDDALLAIMFLTDEQDCSMPEYLMSLRGSYEEPNNPIGSICYQHGAQAGFLDPNRMARLLIGKKGGSKARVAIGFIGGVRQTGQAPLEAHSGEAADCVIADAAVPSTDCSCLANADGVHPERWCAFTDNATDPNAAASVPQCNGMAGTRYVDFANTFDRRTFESVCRNDAGSFGPALSDFARIATLACFSLQGVVPANNDPNMITVRRAAKGAVEDPNFLARQSEDATQPGWYYDKVDKKICLTGLDRLIGDTYDLFILEKDHLDFTKR